MNITTKTAKDIFYISVALVFPFLQTESKYTQKSDQPVILNLLFKKKFPKHFTHQNIQLNKVNLLKDIVENLVEGGLCLKRFYNLCTMTFFTSCYSNITQFGINHSFNLTTIFI